MEEYFDMIIDFDELEKIEKAALFKALEEIQAELNRREAATFLPLDDMAHFRSFLLTI